MSLLEAEMMGKKIIASDIPANREVIENGKNGLLVPVGDIKKLREAMVYMLTNESMAEKMAQAARKNYENKFNFETIFKEKMSCLYK